MLSHLCLHLEEKKLFQICFDQLLTKLIKIFNVEKLQKGGARFDYTKAVWINSKHIQKTENKDLINYTSDEFN